MANLPISGLTASASNLASTDVAPVVQTTGVGPVKMTGLQLAGGLLGSTTFNGATSAGTALTTVAITGTGGQFSCDAATLVVGQNVTISGTLGGTGSITGYSSPTTYTISATNGSTTFTLVNASTGAALTTTAGTPTGLTYVVTSPVVNFTQTWNNSNVTFTGLKFNATDTVSASGSLLLDLQVGGASAFNVTKAGGITFTGTSDYLGGPVIKAVGATAGIGYSTIGSYYTLHNGSTRVAVWGSSSPLSGNFGVLSIGAGCALGFGGENANAFITRPAAATLQLGAADAAGSAIAINSVASNQLTLASDHELSNGAAIIITGTAAPSGTSLNTLYYARSISAAVLELYNTYENAITTSGTTGRVSVTTAGTSASVRLSTPFQTFQPQSFTGTDIPGQPFIINGSRGTGTGPGGDIIFRSSLPGTTGTSQNTPIANLIINGSGGITGQDGTTANTLALRNGTNAQEFRVYGTTDGTNSEYGLVSADTGAVYFGHAKTGTASVREIRFLNGGTVKWKIDTSGNFLTNADNAVDIGAATTTRPRNVFIAGYEQMTEMTAPAAPAANSVRIYAEDNGSGKTRLMALFATGAAQQIAIEP
jgi:hypothetical protein